MSDVGTGPPCQHPLPTLSRRPDGACVTTAPASWPLVRRDTVLESPRSGFRRWSRLDDTMWSNCLDAAAYQNQPWQSVLAQPGTGPIGKRSAGCCPHPGSSIHKYKTTLQKIGGWDARCEFIFRIILRRIWHRMHFIALVAGFPRAVPSTTHDELASIHFWRRA